MKKLFFIIFLILLLILLWYVFVRKYDYILTFKEKSSPGVVYQGTLDWNDNFFKKDSTDSKIISKTPFSNIVQELKTKNNSYVFEWFYKGLNDSITQVKVGILSENSIQNRIFFPFAKKMKKFSRSKLIHFKKSMDRHLSKYSVKIDGISETPSQLCAYISLESKMHDKANQMIKNNDYLLAFIKKDSINIVGKPFVEITHWDIYKGEIKFNYGFPVQINGKIPEQKEILFKKMLPKKAIKATYYGNYRISDKAWFSIYDHAYRNSINIVKTPLEIFYGNPFLGGDESKWRAEIYMPIAE